MALRPGSRCEDQSSLGARASGLGLPRGGRFFASEAGKTERFLAGSTFGLFFLWSLLLFVLCLPNSHSFNKHFNSLHLQIAVARAFQKRRLGLAEAPLPGASASRSDEAPACSAPRLHHPRSGARGLIGREARGD